MDDSKDVEGETKKLPYPKAVFFIIICEFCERFCYYGMRTILTLYFVQVLSWDDNQATVVYHAYVMVSYFTPLIGAMLADSLLGKFQTILYLGIVYCAGCVVLTLAATPPLSIPTVAFSLIGLALIALGTGGIKPCVSAFGADQFKLPEQEVQVASYFALFYFAINSGSLVSTLLTPILREDIKCFDDDHCYSLAFAIPGALMIFALIVFVVGRPLYKVNKPEGNVVLQVLRAIVHALGRRGSEIKAGRPRDHWMDYAEDKFGKRFVAEAKVLLKVLFLYIPVPLFWALFDQQGSRWTLQATRMDGNTWGWQIKPDQMQVVNPLLVLAFIPIFDRGIYPLLAKFNLLKHPLQRLAVGGIFAGIAFVVSGIVELSLENTYATVLKEGEGNFHIINGFKECSISVQFDNGLKSVDIQPQEIFIHEAIKSGTYKFSASGSDKCTIGNLNVEFPITVESEEAKTVFIVPKIIPGSTDVNVAFIEIADPDDMEKADSGNPRLRPIYYGFPKEFEVVSLQGNEEKNIFDFNMVVNDDESDNSVQFMEVEPKEYELSLSHAKNSGFTLGKFDIELGAVYIVSIVRDPTQMDNVDNDSEEYYSVKFHQITNPNSVHMLLLLPQFIIMTMGEVMFSITIMDFSYAEGPPSMKSVMQSTWLLTVAFGNLIVVIIAEIEIFDKQWKEFFLFGGLMFGAMAIFAYMAYNYEPTDRFWLNDNIKSEDEKDDDDEKKKKSDGDIKPLENGHDNEALDKNE